MDFGTVAELRVLDRGPIAGVFVLQPGRLADGRGSFMRVLDERVTQPLVSDFGEGRWVQENQLRSRKGTVRGFHFRAGPDEAKLVRVIVGEAFDVVYDLRPNSPTYQQSMKLILDDRENKQLFIPPGCAHAVQALSESVDLTIRTSAFYTVELDRSFRWDDPDIGIRWPLGDVVLSDRDSSAMPLDAALAEAREIEWRDP